MAALSGPKQDARAALRAALYCAADVVDRVYGNYATEGTGDYARAADNEAYVRECAADVRRAAASTDEALAIARAAKRHALYQGAPGYRVRQIWHNVAEEVAN